MASGILVGENRPPVRSTRATVIWRTPCITQPELHIVVPAAGRESCQAHAGRADRPRAQDEKCTWREDVSGRRRRRRRRQRRRRRRRRQHAAAAAFARGAWMKRDGRTDKWTKERESGSLRAKRCNDQGNRDTEGKPVIYSAMTWELTDVTIFSLFPSLPFSSPNNGINDHRTMIL